MGRRDAGLMILLDTHALLWWRGDTRRLSRRAAREVDRADVVLVSPISCWEVAMLSGKRRIALDRDVAAWVDDLYAEERVEVAPLTPASAVWAAELGDAFPGDPADRFLCATADALRIAFITKDERLHEWAAGQRGLHLVW